MNTIFNDPELRRIDEKLIRLVQSRCRNKISNALMIIMTHLGGGLLFSDAAKIQAGEDDVNGILPDQFF